MAQVRHRASLPRRSGKTGIGRYRARRVVNHDVGWGTKPPTQTLAGVASLTTPDVLFEVEALAARP
jgi:enamine deaminase RidA (YjgF/YER057c/UK114 family)